MASKPVLSSIDNVADENERNERLTKIYNWYTLSTQLKEVKDKEIEARKEIFAENFAGAKEGTNKFGLPDSWVLNATYPFNYKVDGPAFTASIDVLRKAGVQVDRLIEWKPELKISEYRTLTEEQKQLVDQFITITPGTPQIKVVLPARK